MSFESGIRERIPCRRVAVAGRSRHGPVVLRVLLGGLALGGFVLLGACGHAHRPPHPISRPASERPVGREAGSGGTAAPAPAASGRDAVRDPIVARFEGRVIRASELGREVRRFFPEVASAALTRMIGGEVVEREARRHGIRLPAGWESERHKELLGKIEREASLTYGIGTTAEAYVRLRYRRELDDHLRILLEEERFRWLMSRVIRFQARLEDRAELQVIVLRRKQRALEAARKLDQGADFGRLAREMSTHSSAKRDGVLPPLPREALHPVAARAAFALQPGEHTGVLEVDDGAGNRVFEILKLRRLLPGRKLAWEEVRAEVEKELSERPVSEEEWTAWFLRLEKLYKVSVTDND